MKKQSGFTLIELLLVLAIIAVLTAIAAPTFLGQRARARDKAAMANAAALVADMVAGYDKCRETGQDVSTRDTFVANVLGTAAEPRVGAYFSTRNPWGNPANGFSPVLTETATSGTTTLAAASEANLGQVQVGFLPRASNHPATLFFAVYLNQAVGPANAPANTPDAAADSHKYFKVVSLD